MKKLSLFLTLSLLSIISTSTIVKAESAEGSLNQSKDPNSVIISDENADPTGGEVQLEEIEVITGETDEVESSEESAQTLDSEDEMPEEKMPETTENSAPVQ